MIGAGGGRDVLAALVFDQTSVVGVEINEEILRAVTETFGDFTGHLERDPRVHFVNDEARSYIARQRDRYDIIQASLIDTSAATAAGAFVFTENSIYTIEAWRTFFDHLAPKGLLTFSWFYYSDLPAEMVRLTALARAALRERGIADVRAHVLLVRHRVAAKSVGTILVSAEPFSAEDLAAVERVVGAMGFDRRERPATLSSPRSRRVLRPGRAATVRRCASTPRPTTPPSFLTCSAFPTRSAPALPCRGASEATRGRS